MWSLLLQRFATIHYFVEVRLIVTFARTAKGRNPTAQVCGGENGKANPKTRDNAERHSRPIFCNSLGF